MGFSRRWKPSASQKAAYIEKLKERDSLDTVKSNGPIRTGCKVRFFSLNKGVEITGEVIKHSYGTDKGQHTFTILIQDSDEKILVKGRNLYPNLIEHIPGVESKNQ